jgi:hypothetical protein
MKTTLYPSGVSGWILTNCKTSKISLAETGSSGHVEISRNFTETFSSQDVGFEV